MRYSVVLIPTILAVLTATAHADFVLKDHVTNPENWNEGPLIAHQYPMGSSERALGAAATFIGNGKILKTVSGIFAHNSVTGVPNQGSPTSLEFRFAFFETLDAYKADPFLATPFSPNVAHTFESVSNQSDWLVVQGESQDGHDLFRWEVDVESLRIQTVAGQSHVVSLMPETNSRSGATLLSTSNGSNSVGNSADFFARGLGVPVPLEDIGSPVPYAAYRITAIPEPSSVWFVGFAFVFVTIWNYSTHVKLPPSPGGV